MKVALCLRSPIILRLRFHVERFSASFWLSRPSARKKFRPFSSLMRLGEIRSALNTAQNKLQTAHGTAAAQVQSSRETCMLHLQISTLLADDLLEAVQQAAESSRAAGNRGADRRHKTRRRAFVSRQGDRLQQAVGPRDITALSDAAKGFPDLAKNEAATILADLAKLEADSALLAALQRRSFVEKGLDLVDGPECPLCDTPWEDEQHLRDHLKAKLAKSEEARKLQQALLSTARRSLRKPSG